MSRKKKFSINWSIISLVIAVILFIVTIPDHIAEAELKKECEILYQKELLTPEDMEIGSTYKTSTAIFTGEEDEGPPEQIKFKKLYGIEPIGTYEIDKNGGLEVEFVSGKAKILIIDQNGQQRYYEELESPESLSFEPGQSGKYDVYIFGNKSTVRVLLSTY